MCAPILSAFSAASSVAAVKRAVRLRVNGADLLSPAAFRAADSVWRTTPTWQGGGGDGRHTMVTHMKRAMEQLLGLGLMLVLLVLALLLAPLLVVVLLLAVGLELLLVSLGGVPLAYLMSCCYQAPRMDGQALHRERCRHEVVIHVAVDPQLLHASRTAPHTRHVCLSTRIKWRDWLLRLAKALSCHVRHVCCHRACVGCTCLFDTSACQQGAGLSLRATKGSNAQ